MKLVRLIYASRKTEHWNDQELQKLTAQASEYNRKHAITGVLIFNRKNFLQCIEGERSKVSALFQKIAHDDRHQNIELISVEQVDEREMERWNMCYIPDSNITQELVLKYSDSDDFNPFEMSARGAFSFIRHACGLMNRNAR